MQGSLDESAAKFEDPDVLARVSDLERRVAALENLSGVQPALKPDEVLLRNLPPVPAGSVPIVGRALLGLAGAYLLRAIAESGTAPRTATVIVALLYAGAWLVSPIRTRGAETFRAIVYTVTAALIFAPLVWETTVRFQVLSPAAAALVLVLFVIAGNAVAWRRNLDAIGRIAMLAGAGTALGLLVATRDLAPFTIALLAMALTAEYAACRDRLTGERWIAAVSADASLLFLTYILTRPQGLPEGYRAVPAVLAVAIQAAALAIYLGSISFRTLARGLEIAWFEVGQLSAVFAISIGGALQVTRGSAAAIVGGFCMLSGAGAYLTALVLLDRRTGRRNFYAYATWGLALLLAGGAILFSGIVLTAIWSALAILAMTVGRRTGLVVLRAHASVYMAGAAVVSGLLRFCLSASVAPATRLSALAPAAVLAACAVALCYAASGATPTIAVRIPAAIAGGLLCWSMLAIGSGALAALKLNPGALAALRTFLLCAVAIGVALAGARWGRAELLWLQYAVMLSGAALLLFEDFPIGSPAVLALSLLAYGSTLILLPRCRLVPLTPRS